MDLRAALQGDTTQTVACLSVTCICRIDIACQTAPTARGPCGGYCNGKPHPNHIPKVIRAIACGPLLCIFISPLQLRSLPD